MPKQKPLGHYRQRFGIYKVCEWCCRLYHCTRRDARLCSPRCRQAWKRAAAQADRELKKYD